MNAPLGEIGVARFLTEFWQKKPCLIRQAFPGFVSPLDGDDLAGLACDELAESRWVIGNFRDRNWQLRTGPFSDGDFTSLPENDWTLLVQDVEKHYPPLQDLMSRFDFLPGWRLDDLMVSFAAAGGSVGPHVDQYDVFLLQGKGRRHWQIAASFEPALLADCPLNVLERFIPEEEWTLEPGDMLYLPPNLAHHGIALEPGVAYSIGLRAPSAADLMQALGEWLSFRDTEGGRYSDPDLHAPNRLGEIDRQALEGLRQLLNKGIETPGLDRFLAAFISRFRLAHEPAPRPEAIKPGDVRAAIENGAELLRNPWTRIYWIDEGSGARLYAAGQAYDCSIVLAESLYSPAGPGSLKLPLADQDITVLTALVNDGHLLLSR